MDAFLVSLAAVAIAEIGDRTQFLAVLLAVRYQRPFPVLGGMLVAILANHALAAWLGAAAADLISAGLLRWLLGLGFLAMAAWCVLPDPDSSAPPVRGDLGAFAASALAFFLAEMADKTQLATVALAARFAEPLPVLLGSTLGLVLVNAPLVLCGAALLRRIPASVVRALAALVFAGLGCAVLLGPLVA